EFAVFDERLLLRGHLAFLREARRGLLALSGWRLRARRRGGAFDSIRLGVAPQTEFVVVEVLEVLALFGDRLDNFGLHVLATQLFQSRVRRAVLVGQPHD